MPVKIKEWIQREWTTPNANLYRDRGDFDTFSSLFLTRNRRRIQRGPAWSSAIAFPANFTDCRGAYYHETNGYTCFIGQNATPNMVWCYADSAWSMSAIQAPVLTAATTNLGGLFGRNIVWRGGALYVIGADSNVYGTSPTAGLGLLYNGGDARILTESGDRVFLIAADGDMGRLNDAGSAFTAHFTKAANIDFLYAAPFKNNIALLADDGDGDFTIYYIATKDPYDLQPIARINVAGNPAPVSHAALYDQSCLFTIHNDDLYFLSFPHAAGSTNDTDLYRFNGSYAEHIAHLPAINAHHRLANAGLASWNGELILYLLTEGATQTQTFYILTGSSFTTLTTISADASGMKPFAFSLSDELILLADPSSAEGIYHANRTALVDGNYQTSWLDMDSPAKEKRLEQITVLLNNHASGFKTVVKYRADDATSWTTATTGNNTRRVTIAALGAAFYRLQLRIELDDDTGNNEDIGIDSVSALYTIQE